MPPIMLSNKFPSKAELNFFRVLRQVVGDRGHILYQVSLATLFYVGDHENRHLWNNKLRQRSVDFLLCDRDGLAPLIAIELDDSSHDGEKRKSRDKDVNDAFAAAGLTLLRQDCRKGYAPRDLEELIGPALATAGVKKGIRA
jgi:hypothetical protein